jgi:hypothetical protein
MKKFFELFEKAFVEIEIFSVTGKVQFIVPPFIVMIDLHIFIRRIETNDLFSACIAGSTIELPFIPP